MSTHGYIDFALYKSALECLDRDGVAACITLPFGAHSGHLVNIGGREYVLLQPVTEDGPVARPDDICRDEIVGYVVKPA